jgi:hypothetical protein
LAGLLFLTLSFPADVNSLFGERLIDALMPVAAKLSRCLPQFCLNQVIIAPRLLRVERGPMDVYVLLVIATLAPGQERAEEYRSYHSLAHCERHARALRRQGSAGRYKIKFECRSLKSYALLVPSPKASLIR